MFLLIQHKPLNTIAAKPLVSPPRGSLPETLVPTSGKLTKSSGEKIQVKPRQIRNSFRFGFDTPDERKMQAFARSGAEFDLTTLCSVSTAEFAFISTNCLSPDPGQERSALRS